MRVGISLLKILATYVSAVLVVALVVLTMASYPSGDWWDIFSRGSMPFVMLSAVFALPVFVLCGLPYLAFGYRSWGRENELSFLFGGAVLGCLGSLAFGMLLVMPQTVPVFFPLIGLAAGAVSSFVWAKLTARWTNRVDD